MTATNVIPMADYRPRTLKQQRIPLSNALEDLARRMDQRTALILEVAADITAGTDCLRGLASQLRTREERAQS